MHTNNCYRDASRNDKTIVFHSWKHCFHISIIIRSLPDFVHHHYTQRYTKLHEACWFIEYNEQNAINAGDVRKPKNSTNNDIEFFWQPKILDRTTIRENSGDKKITTLWYWFCNRNCLECHVWLQRHVSEYQTHSCVHGRQTRFPANVSTTRRSKK